MSFHDLRMSNMFPSIGSNFGDFDFGPSPFPGLMSMLQNQSVPTPNYGMGPLGQIANDVAQPKPMDVVFNDNNVTPYQKEIIALRAKELEQRDSSQDANRDLAEQRVQQGQKRIDIAKQKADNPNLRIIAQKDGNVVGYDPITGESKILGTHGLSETERIQKNQENAIDRINETSETAEARALRLEALRNKNRTDLENNVLQPNRVALKGTETPKTETELERERHIKNNYSTMLNEHPEWREFVEPDQAGNPVLKDVSDSWFKSGPDKDTYTKIFNYLYGTEAPVSTVVPKIDTKVETPKVESKTKTVYRNGKPFTIPSNISETQLKRDGFSLTK